MRRALNLRAIWAKLMLSLFALAGVKDGWAAFRRRDYATA